MRWLVILAITTRVAVADPAHDAYRAALEKSDIGALEAIGQGPATVWTDDAWIAAARLAEKTGDYARARADYAHAIATAEDDIVRGRAQTALARLSATNGATGQWDAIVVEHSALVSQILGNTGSPEDAIAALAELVRAHPDYPGATAARLAIAQGWERQGELGRGIEVIDEAIATAPTPELRGRAHYAAFHARVHARDIDGARAELDAIAKMPDADTFVTVDLEQALATAQLRKRIRFGAWGFLGFVGALAIWRARRDAKGWRAAGRALWPPPVEVWYLAPLLAGLALIAHGGNPMIARALRAIGVCGVLAAWLSGASLKLAKPLTARRVLPHIAAVVLALIAMVFLVVDRDRLIDLLVETWRSGPAL